MRNVPIEERGRKNGAPSNRGPRDETGPSAAQIPFWIPSRVRQGSTVSAEGGPPYEGVYLPFSTPVAPWPPFRLCPFSRYINLIFFFPYKIQFLSRSLIKNTDIDGYKLDDRWMTVPVSYTEKYYTAMWTLIIFWCDIAFGFL